MDHLLKELLDEIKEQNEDILDELEIIKEKLGIESNKDDDNDEADDKDLDF